MEHILFEAVTGIFAILALYLYLNTMLGSRKDISAILYWFWLILMYVLPIPASDYFFGTYTTLKAITLTLLTFITTFGITFLYKATLRHRLFTALMYVFLEDICELIPAQLLILLSRHLVSIDIERIELMVQAQQNLWFL